MTFEDAMRQLGHQTGVDIRLDAGRSAQLVFDGHTAVDFENPPEGNGSMLMHSVVGLLPAAGRREATYEMLLTGNLFGRDTGAATLAVDADLGEILLFRRLDLATLTYDGFVGALEEFIARAKAWADRLKTAGDPGGSAPPSEADSYMLRA